ncbi:MAG TPA: CusA/CzcA family heavy metal efflux RND transporter [Planctomycetota bacterium]|nr:CusA/CzcA family heavy metal efflux RND transporter [Planctomycetota bacterium]
MIERLIAAAQRQHFLVFTLVVLVAAGGLFGLSRLNVDAFPDVTTVQVDVGTEAPGLAPEEVEQLITFPIENAMNGLPHVEVVRSISKFGLSVVTVVFKDGTDIDFARQLVFERLEQARAEVPAGFSPEMGPITTGVGQIFMYQVAGPGWSNMDLRALHDWTIAFQLRTVPGVADVLSFGGDVKQYQVAVDPARLVDRQVTLGEVFEAIEANNVNTGGNYIVHGPEQYVVRGVGLASTLQDIGDIVVTSRQGVPVYVRDVATLAIGPEIRQGAATMNGQGEVVTGIVLQQIGTNTKQVIEDVKAQIAAIQAGLPPGVRIVPFYDQAVLVDQSIRGVSIALVEGLLFVTLVLFLLLGNLRASLITALAIPVSMLVAFLVMWFTDLSANLMSLGGLAISVGMMVDATLIMVENIYRHISEGKDEHGTLTQRVLAASVEIGRPVFYAILVIVAVFLPLYTLTGIEGKLFTPLARTVTYAMLGSLVMALLITPTLSIWVFRRAKTKPTREIVTALRRPYLATLAWALDRPFVTVAAYVLALGLSLAALPFLGSEFIPTLDEGSLLVRATLPASVSLDEAMRLARGIERRFMAFPEVTLCVSKIGRAELGGDPEAVSNDEIYVALKPRDEWTTAHDKAALVSALRASVADVPGVDFIFSQTIQLRVDELISGISADIAIKIFGDDTTVLKQKADEVSAAVADVPGTADLAVEQVEGEKLLQIRIRRDQIARYGINVADVQDVIETAIGGKSAGEVFEGQKRFDIQVRFAEKSRDSLQAIQDVLVAAPDGQRIPMLQLADFSLAEGAAVIEREHAQRRIYVRTNVVDRDIGSYVADAKAAIAAKVTLPPGYTIRWGGQFENKQRATERLLLVIPIALLLVLILIYRCFDSLRNLLVVTLNIPLALVGGQLVLQLLGMPLSVPALVGYIAVFGVGVQNAMVMVHCFNRLRAEGRGLREAVLEGAALRFRPELLSVVIGALALVPLLVSNGTGVEIEKPLAAVVVGGLLARPLTIVVLPVCYDWIEKRALRRQAAVAVAEARP